MQDLAGISNQIWDLKYRLKTAEGEPLDESVEDTWSRVALAVSAAETTQARKQWAGEFVKILKDFRFLPAGRVVAGAGSGRAGTLLHCFVMGSIGGDKASSFVQLKEAALSVEP